MANLHRALTGAEPTRLDVGPAGVDDAAARLSRHYIPARYPDAHPAGPPAAHYRAGDATDALADARAVLAWADAAWELVCTASGSP